ncbi:MAG: S41 family peptidase [Muribaculaceae bacterium]|nr:S41 family peptidase [Muribaculaceae bacterium]
MGKKLRNLALAALAIGLAAPAAITGQSKKQSDDAAVIRNLDIFNSIYKELNTFYVDTLDAKQTITTAINSMLDNIDPYTEYIPAEDQDDFMVISTGEYGGIGSYIMTRHDSTGVCISEPYEGSPAAKAGLKPGDRIVAIDGDTATKWKDGQVSKRLKGQANTQLKLTVVRPYVSDSVKTFTITREKIKVNPVPYYGVTHGNLGYINITTYNEHTAEQVKAAVEALQHNPAVKCLVLDLRGNGGGLVDEAVKMIGFFVPKGTEVLQTKGRNTLNFKSYKTTEDPIAPTMPLVVMVDGGSASASEITAGALQDLDRAVVVGSRSFGKGLVQQTRQLPFDGMLKVTVAKYYIPSGRLIQEIDYSHRNADGEAQRIPDSLTTVYHTAHGREVRDGGGITPDIKVTYPELNRLVYNIVRDNWAFDFATKYAAEHASIAPAAEFAVTDTIFNEFKRFIDPKRFNYDKVCEQGLSQLKKVAEAEGYMTDSTKAEFAKLEKLLKHNLDHDLDNNRKAISQLLSGEILKRYYYQRGVIENSLNSDEALDKTEAMISKPGEYEHLLNLDAKTKTKVKAKTPAKRAAGKKRNGK